MDGWDVLDHARELSRRGEEFALATVVWRAGPTSGQPGARAVITTSGQIYGFIGGACAEPVVVREAQRVIAEGTPKLLALGAPEQFANLPEGMTAIVMACQSEGALQVYIEPVVPSPHLTVVGRSPMAHTLADLARALGWQAQVRDWPEFSAAELNQRSIVVVATQGHGDEEALEQALTSAPAFVGLVASRKRGEAVLGALEDRGVPRNLLDRVRVPVGLDLGHTTHREIAVAILAELVKLRAAGDLGVSTQDAQRAPAVAGDRPTLPVLTASEAVDPVCGMTVKADSSSRPYEFEGTTYYFCCPACRRAFERDPHAYLTTQEA
jgi:xanthine dehydrogenase accessory factor